MTSKILVLPSKSIYWNPSDFQIGLRNKLNEYLQLYFPNFFETLKVPKSLRKKNFLDYLSLKLNNFPLPGNDLAWWGRLHEIDQVEVKIVGHPNSSFFNSELESEIVQKWPVLFGFEPHESLSFDESLINLKNFDYLLVSSRFDKKFKMLLEKARKIQIPIAYIDAFDDEPIYEFGKNYLSEKYSFFYDLFFKKDLPLGLKSEKILPLAPMPYSSKLKMVFKEKKSLKSIFFSGTNRKNITRPDRELICNFIEKSFPDSKIFLNKPKLPEDKYNFFLKESLIQLSPSGRVWDSFRHISAAIDSPLLVIPKNDCELTWDIFKDGVNCIMYDPKKLDTENLNILKSRIESLVNDESLSLKMRKNYFDSVSGKCSQFNASDYILKELKSIR
tara:strand:+ start:330 stop:1493 length:1164 start_codon:yes stop_codon:yes gene_type:complete